MKARLWTPSVVAARSAFVAALALAGVALLTLPGCDLVGTRSPLTVAWKGAPDPEGESVRASATDGVRYFAMGRYLTAYDAATGATLWQRQSNGEHGRGLAVAGGRVLTASQVAVALDAATGREVWRHAAPGSAYYTLPAADGKAFYGGTRQREAFALDAATGALRWSVNLGPDWDGGVASGVGVEEGTVFVTAQRDHLVGGARYRSTVVAALDAGTGAERWRFTDGEGRDFRMPTSRPVVAGDLVLFVDHVQTATEAYSRIFALDRATGRERWRLRTPLGLNGPAEAPHVAGDLAYVASDVAGYALRVRTGEVVWRTEVYGSSVYYAAVCGRVLLTAPSPGVLDLARGRLLEDAVAGFSPNSFAVSGRRAFFVTYGGQPVAVDCPG